MFHFIQRQEDFIHVLQLMDQYSTYGLDTEFIKVDTLWPKLGLLQINLNHQIYLLDGTTLHLDALWPRLFNAKQNIFHACSEDIDLIYHYAKQPTIINNVFDTQVALSFLGHGLQVSYQNALKLILDIEIEKDQTRSNWLARPLTVEQLKYAANDVCYIFQLSEKLKKQLQDKQLYDFVLQDCASLTEEIARETPSHLLYTDIANYRHSRKQLMQLQQLSLWREQLIKALNQPRSFILKNTTMIDLVEKNPKNTFQLAQIKEIRPHVVREHGKTILDLLKFLPDESEWPLRLARPIRHSSEKVTLEISALVDDVSQDMQIPKEVLLRKKWLNSIYQHVVFQDHQHNLPSYLLGWRYNCITQPLIDILQKDKNYMCDQIQVKL